MFTLATWRFILSICLIFTTIFGIYATGAALFTGAWNMFFIAAALFLANLGAGFIVSILST